MTHASTDAHVGFMRVALAEARLALEAGNMPIGAVIARGSDVLATGRNAVDRLPNDTHRAELAAIQSIAPYLAEHKRERVLYTTLEPCMMCLGAMINVGIESLVVAASGQLVGALSLLTHGEYYTYKRCRLKRITGILASESQELLNEYVRRTGFRGHLGNNAA